MPCSEAYNALHCSSISKNVLPYFFFYDFHTVWAIINAGIYTSNVVYGERKKLNDVAHCSLMKKRQWKVAQWNCSTYFLFCFFTQQNIKFLLTLIQPEHWYYFLGVDIAVDWSWYREMRIALESSWACSPLRVWNSAIAILLGAQVVRRNRWALFRWPRKPRTAMTCSWDSIPNRFPLHNVYMLS